MQAITCGRRLVVRCGRELSGETVLLADELTHRAGLQGRTVLLDLSGAAFVDSDGLRWLMRFREEMAASGTPFRVLVGAGSRVRRTLALSGCDQCLPVFHSGRAAWRGVAA